MKRLLTIFLSSIACVSLLGQSNVPMTIIGDMFIADSGKVVSKGTVHIKQADGSASVGKVANYGRLAMDTVVFYTNATADGLLMNQNHRPGSTFVPAEVTASKVAVRKEFRKTGNFMLSIPFDVDWTKVMWAETGQVLTRETHYRVRYYDPYLRAKYGQVSDSNWVYSKITAAGTALKKENGSLIKKGESILIEVNFRNVSSLADTTGAYNGGFSLLFISADTPENVEYLFEPQAKGYDITWAAAPWFATQFSEGWNAVGGLNSTNFLINDTTIDYNDTGDNKTIYYWDGSSGLEWQELDPETEQGTLRPYGAIFLKTDVNTDTVYKSALNKGGFVFLDGITLDATPPMFRSTPGFSKDILGVQFFAKNNTDFISKVYFKFREGVNKFYNPHHDGFRLTTYHPTVPIMWGIAFNESNGEANELFTKSLPYGENEVPLGVNIPAAGEYVFALNEVSNRGITSAVLWDKASDSKTDLFSQNYTFQANGTIKSEDRFVLFFNGAPTSIDQIEKATFYAYVENNVLTVKNLLQGDKVQVLDLTGRIIASGVVSGDSFSVPLNQKGVYIVNANGGKTLKVINK